LLQFPFSNFDGTYTPSQFGKLCRSFGWGESNANNAYGSIVFCQKYNIKMDANNEKVTPIPIKSEFNDLNIFDKDSSSANINSIICSYCSKPFTEELWCKECDPFRMIRGWTSGNHDIDKFIKDSIYDAREYVCGYNIKFLQWVQYDRFEDMKQIGEGRFAKVYSATWIDGEAEYKIQDDGSWKKRKPEPIKVALKWLNGSQNMSAEYLNEVIIFIINLHI